MKLTKKIFALLALVFALVAVTACSSNSSSGKSTAKARTIEEIKKSGELRIAVFADKKPFGYVDNKGAYQGYDIELGNRIIFMDKGVIAEEGTAEEFFNHPKTQRAQEFLNVFDFSQFGAYL